MNTDKQELKNNDWVYQKDSRGQGIKGSSDCKAFSLEPLNPRILGP